MFSFLLSIIPILFSLLPFKDYLLGINQPTTYLFLLQNDKEIRTHGGFPGSYATIIINSSPISLQNLNPHINLKFSFQDIYVPSGQINGHIDQPLPLQQAFKQGTLLLPNAGWNPDFPTTATTFRWFFDQAGETSPDIFATITFSTINKLLEITGPITLSDGQNLDSHSLYFYLQNQSETDFFPGSTQKKDALTITGKAFVQKATSLPFFTKIKLLTTLITELNHGNILLQSSNQSFQQQLSKLHWDGSWQPPHTYDYLGIIEDNLGANKANNFVQRQTDHELVATAGAITHYIHLYFSNTSPKPNPEPPDYYGGNYIAYLRFFLPSNAQNVTLSQTNNLPHEFPGVIIENQNGFTQVGFFHTTAASSSSSLVLSYALPPTPQYNLTLLKQHGLPTSHQNLILFGKTLSTNLESDFFTPTTKIK